MTPQLGDKVQEKISEYTGIVTGYVTYLWGCEQVLVGRKDKDGKPEAEWFDIGRVDILERGSMSASPVPEAVTGPDRAAPIR